MIKKLKIITVILLMLMTIPIVSSQSDVVDYSFPDVIKIMNITEDGTVIVTEDMVYSITGSTEGIYRELPLSANQSIDNISVETPGLYNTVIIENTTDNIRITVNLYKDEAKTQFISNEDVDVIYHYNLHGALVKYGSLVEFNVGVWNPQWNKGVDNVATYITVPGDFKSVQTSLNTMNYLVNSSWASDNTFITFFESIPEDATVIQTLDIPESYFTTTDNIMEGSTLSYEGSSNVFGLIQPISIVILLILICIPIFIYVNYGIEPKLKEDLTDDLSIPNNDSLLVINVMNNEYIGKSNINSVKAVILDLLKRGYIKIVNIDERVISLNWDNKDNLNSYEFKLMNFLKTFEDDKSNISIVNIVNFMDRNTLDLFHKRWLEDVEKEKESHNFDELFDNRSARYLSKLTIIAIVIGLIFFIYYHNNILFIFPTIVLVEYLLIRIKLNKGKIGHLTLEGLKYTNKWQKFINYIELNNMSLEQLNNHASHITALNQLDNLRHKILNNYTYEQIKDYECLLFVSNIHEFVPKYLEEIE